MQEGREAELAHAPAPPARVPNPKGGTTRPTTDDRPNPRACPPGRAPLEPRRGASRNDTGQNVGSVRADRPTCEEVELLPVQGSEGRRRHL